MKLDFKTISGIKTCFVKHGTGKEKIICLHGWGGSKESWDDFVPNLIKKTATTIVTVDLPGFGKSGMPPVSGWNTTQYALWLEKLLTNLDWKNPTLIGHSFGCRVIVRFLEKHPEFKGEIVLLGAAGIKWPPGLRQKITTKIKPLVLPFKKIVPNKIWNKVIGKIFGARDWANCPTEIKKTLEKTLKEPCIRNTLKNIKNEVLLLWGKNDGYTPLKSAKIFQENLQNATLHVFEDGRHGIHRTHATQCVNKITTFLKK
jgi:pimeloyl-ACP methyl ester carboxylesterase